MRPDSKTQVLLSKTLDSPARLADDAVFTGSNIFMKLRVSAGWIFGVLLGAVLALGAGVGAAAEDAARWWKGNLHTHSLWSDGDDYPEMIVEWYAKRGYNFLGISDHNTLQEGEKWVTVSSNRFGAEAFKKYLARHGEQWVARRQEKGKTQVRLKTMAQYAPLFNEPGKFLLLSSEELTDRYKTSPIHMNVTNLREALKPRGGNSVVEVIENNLKAVFEQRRKTGQPMFAHLNHPNFGWGVTAEEMMQVRGERFFEVYNGHPTVHNEGDTNHAGTERIWDIVLTRRLTELKLDVVFGMATDDSHNYHTNAVGKSNSGRGWVMVRAASLAPAALVAAMEAGDFYSSNGVELLDVTRATNRLALRIRGEPGVTYKTQFIGTRKGFDPKSEPVRASNGDALRITHRYSADVGAVLAEVAGTEAAYELKGDEIYVRARVVSSKLKDNPSAKGELEMAWTQPVVTGVK